MRNNRNTVFMLNRCSNGDRTRTFAHHLFFYRPVGHFLIDHFIPVGRDINIFWLKIDQAFNRTVNITCITSLQRRKQFK